MAAAAPPSSPKPETSPVDSQAQPQSEPFAAKPLAAEPKGEPLAAKPQVAEADPLAAEPKAEPQAEPQVAETEGHDTVEDRIAASIEYLLPAMAPVFHSLPVFFNTRRG